MVQIKKIALRSFIFILMIMIFCGIYTLLITLIAQTFFRDKANGSIIETNGVKYGSRLIGQNFTGSRYMWGRAMDLYKESNGFIDSNGKQSLYPLPSNLSPASIKYERYIKQRIRKIKAAHPDNKDVPVPVELVTNSGSGLDPHISRKAALYQSSRIAKARNISADEVVEIINRCTDSRFLGIFGEKTVNVLEVNLYLDNILK